VLDYLGIRSESDAAIESAGRAAKFRKKALNTVGNPWDGSDDVGVDVDVIAVFVDYKTNEIDGSVIQRGDKKCLVSPKYIADMKEFEKVIDDGEWQIVDYSEVKPAAVSMLYKVQLRR